MKPRDEQFNKWQLYHTSLVDEFPYYAVWHEFLEQFHFTPKSMGENILQLHKVPLWLEKRFGIANNRQSHSLILGKDYLSFAAEPGQENNAPAMPCIARENLISHELEAWSIRNLNIFFLEFVICNEIAVLDNTIDDNYKSLISDNNHEELQHLYKNILKVINDAYFYGDLQHTQTNLNIPHLGNYDIDDEFNYLFNIIMQLRELNTLDQFKQLYAEINTQNHYVIDRRGIEIKDLIQAITNPKPVSIPKMMPMERKLPEPDNPPKRSLAYKITIAAMVGMSLGLLCAGMAAAIIFTGGFAALGMAATIAILTLSGSLPVVSSIGIGLGVMCAKKETGVSSTAQIHSAMRSVIPTKVGIQPTTLQPPVMNTDFRRDDNVKDPLFPDAPFVQSQHSKYESTRSVSLH